MQEIRLDEINFRSVAKELLRNLWMIFAAAAIVWFGITGAGKLTYTPEYTSSATLVVRVKGDASSITSLNAASKMAAVFGEIFQSESLRGLITSDVGENINGSISCTGIEETNLLVLKTTAATPRQAYLFINAALRHYEDVSEYVFSNAALDIVQEPNVPETPSNHPALIGSRNLLSLAGALAMACVIVLFYVLRVTVKTASSAQRLLDGTVMGTIPLEKRPKTADGNGKVALLIQSPIVSMGFVETVRRISSRIETHLSKNKQKVVLVVSVGENEGKSTVAANIALSMAEKHKKVLLVDGDLRKPAQYKIFDYKEDPRSSLSAVLAGKQDWKEAVRENSKNGLFELFQMKPVSNPSPLLDPKRLVQFVSQWREKMDYIIIDSSPTALTTDAELWMQAADTTVMVVRQDWADVRVVNDTVDMVWKSCGDFAGFVLNQFNDATVLTSNSGYAYQGSESSK